MQGRHSKCISIGIDATQDHDLSWKETKAWELGDIQSHTRAKT